MPSPARTRVVGALLVGAVALTGCSLNGSSSSNSSVSQSQVESKLKSDNNLSTEKHDLQSAQFDKLVTCLATTLKKHATAADLKSYVGGSKNLYDVQGTDASTVQSDAQKCMKDNS